MGQQGKLDWWFCKVRRQTQQSGSKMEWGEGAKTNQQWMGWDLGTWVTEAGAGFLLDLLVSSLSCPIFASTPIHSTLIRGFSSADTVELELRHEAAHRSLLQVNYLPWYTPLSHCYRLVSLLMVTQ
jgi:hypothetical protein